MAVDEDAVLLAGKGHEREVHLGDTEYPCDDREESRAVLGEMGYGVSGHWLLDGTDACLPERQPRPRPAITHLREGIWGREWRVGRG